MYQTTCHAAIYACDTFGWHKQTIIQGKANILMTCSLSGSCVHWKQL